MAVALLASASASYGQVFYTGYWDDGYCRYVGGVNSVKSQVDAFEGQIGKRVAGYQLFAGGVLVELKNGVQIPIWRKEIDCKDPPYNPLASVKAK